MHARIATQCDKCTIGYDQKPLNLSPAMRPTPPHMAPNIVTDNLNVLAHHGNHQVEKTNSLNESETQNGVGEELTTHGWVTGDSGEEGSENETDTEKMLEFCAVDDGTYCSEVRIVYDCARSYSPDTGTSKTDGSVTHTQVL